MNNIFEPTVKLKSGGYLVIKHEIKDQTFYSLYGHLKTPHKVQLGQELVAGQELGKIGKESDSGGWFCHLHLQIITQKAMNKGYSEWGYISKELLTKVEGESVYLEEYTRDLIGQEEQHQLELRKMLKDFS